MAKLTSEEQKAAAKAKRAAKKVFGLVVLDKELVFLIGQGVICHGPIFKEGSEGQAARAKAKIVDVTHYPEHDAFVATEDAAPVAKARYRINFESVAARVAWADAEMEYETEVGPNLDVTTHEVLWSDLTEGQGFDGVAAQLDAMAAEQEKTEKRATNAKAKAGKRKAAAKYDV